MKDNFEYALEFAIDRHRGQIDKGWTPYIQHLLGVWSRVRFQDLKTQIVALLHDVIEDTGTSYEILASEFGTDVADTVELLTHKKGLAYEAYVLNIIESGNIAAIRVKIADLEDNSSDIRLQRLPDSKRDYFKRRITAKYEPARKKLHQALTNLLFGGSL